jgi:adenosylhomocysteine nucleosidase
MIAILAALETELRGLRRHLRRSHTVQHECMTIVEGFLANDLRSRFSGQAHPVLRLLMTRAASAANGQGSDGRAGGKGSEVVLVTSGMGRQSAEQAADYVLTHYKPAALLTAGFAGAVVRNLRAGDVIICTQQYGLNHMPSYLPAAAPFHKVGQAQRGADEAFALEGPISSDQRLVSLWKQALPTRRYWRGSHSLARVARGAALTVPELVTDRQMKEWLGWQFAVVVIDMESYWVAQRAAARGVPFLNIRAVSDTLDQQLPPLMDLVDRQGQPHTRAMCGYLWRHPRQIGNLCLLGIHSWRAARALTRALLHFAISY